MKRFNFEGRRLSKPTVLGAMALILGLGIINQSCSGGGSSSGGGGGGSSVNSLAFPNDLAVASPTASSSTLMMGYSNDLGAFAIDSGAKASDKKQAMEQVLSNSNGAGCSIAITTIAPTNATCYGPQLSYQNHPDGTASGNCPGSAPFSSYPCLPTGDLGIWTATESTGEACAAAELNSRIKGVASQVDAGLFTMAGMICALKLSGQSEPTLGNTVDLTSSLSGKITIDGQVVSLTSATITATTATAGTAYVSQILGTTNSGTKVYSIRLKHIPTNSDNSTYTGKLSISKIQAGAPGQVDATSILYNKSSASSTIYELRSANFSGSSTDPYVSSTNKSVKLTTGWANNANYIITQYDPSTFTGNVLYAWQAGSGDSHTRVFNANISGTTNPTGTAYFGFGPNFGSGSGYGSITGMICNWAGPGNSHTPVTKVQKQTMTTSGGKFVVSTSNITYDPVNACESNSGTFQYSTNATTWTTANTTTENLVSQSEVASNITAPTAPTDVD